VRKGLLRKDGRHTVVPRRTRATLVKGGLEDEGRGLVEPRPTATPTPVA